MHQLDITTVLFQTNELTHSLDYMNCENCVSCDFVISNSTPLMFIAQQRRQNNDLHDINLYHDLHNYAFIIIRVISVSAHLMIITKRFSPQPWTLAG